MRGPIGIILALSFIVSAPVFAQTKSVPQDVVLVDDISFEEAGNIKLILALNKPDKVFCYDIKNPPQIIIDLLGNAYFKGSEQLSVNKSGIKRISASKDFGKTNLASDKNYYPVDFFVVELDEPKEYKLASGKTKAVVEIGALRAEERMPLEEDMEPATEEPESVKEGTRIAKLSASEKPKEEVRRPYKPDIAREGAIEEKFQEEPQPREEAKIPKYKEAPTLTLARKKSVEMRNKGYTAQTQGKFDKAQECYQLAIKLDPKYSTPHNDLGIIYEEKGLLEKAGEEYKKAIELDPNYAAAYSNLALLYEKQAKLSEALPYWQKRASLGEPDDPWTIRAKDKLQRYNK